MQIENPAMIAWFDKSDVYFSVDVGVGEPTNKLHEVQTDIRNTKQMGGGSKDHEGSQWTLQ